MRLTRSFLQAAICGLVGLGLSFILYACQANLALQPSIAEPPHSATSSPSPVPSPSPLPLATQAIIDRVGNLYDPPRGDVRLLVISDLNSAYGSTDYEAEVDTGIALAPFWHPDLVICGGDMVAGQSSALTEAEIRAMWAGFDRHIAAPLRQAHLPFGFTVGNHDASAAQGVQGQFLFQNDRDIAAAYWRDPAHDPGLEFVDRFEFPFYYSFQQQGIFFLVWDGSTSHIPSDKLAWVEKTLASEAAQSAKLRILLGHLPLYGVAVGRDKPGEVMDNADTLRALLERHHVHTYISGHHHAYYPAHRGQLQLLHTGILGAGPRPLIDSDLPPRKTITVVDVDFDSPNQTTYTTYDMKTLKPISPQVLPRFLVAHNGLVLRRDIEPTDLTAAERTTCEQRLGPAPCRA